MKKLPVCRANLALLVAAIPERESEFVLSDCILRAAYEMLSPEQRRKLTNSYIDQARDFHDPDEPGRAGHEVWYPHYLQLANRAMEMELK